MSSSIQPRCFLSFLFAIYSLKIFILRVVSHGHKMAVIAPGIVSADNYIKRQKKEHFSALPCPPQSERKRFSRNISEDLPLNSSVRIELHVHALVIKANIGIFSLQTWKMVLAVRIKGEDKRTMSHGHTEQLGILITSELTFVLCKVKWSCFQFTYI